METTASSCPPAHSIGKLCVGGDWAWAHGDVSALRHIAQQLAVRFGEPTHCDLMNLAELCLHDLDAAGALWAGLKARLYPTSPQPIAHRLP